MEKITYGKSASSRVAAVLRMINAKFNKTPFSVEEGKSEDAEKVWGELAYKKKGKVSQQVAEHFEKEKATKHPLFFSKRRPQFIEQLGVSTLFNKGIETMSPGQLISYFWGNEIKALEKIGDAVPKEVVEPPRSTVKKAAPKLAGKPKAAEKKVVAKKTTTKKKAAPKKKVAPKKKAAPKKKKK